MDDGPLVLQLHGNLFLAAIRLFHHGEDAEAGGLGGVFAGSDAMIIDAIIQTLYRVNLN